MQMNFIKEALEDENVHLLTDWEYDRMNEWSDYPEDRPLTSKQNKILNQIHNKIQES